MKKLVKWFLLLFKKTPKPTLNKTPQPPRPTPTSVLEKTYSYNVNGLEEGVVLGFGVDPVEDFGDLCVVGLVGHVVDKIKQRAYCVSVFIVAIIRNRGDIEIIHYAKGEEMKIFNFFSC